MFVVYALGTAGLACLSAIAVEYFLCWSARRHAQREVVRLRREFASRPLPKENDA